MYCAPVFPQQKQTYKQYILCAYLLANVFHRPKWYFSQRASIPTYYQWRQQHTMPVNMNPPPKQAMTPSPCIDLTRTLQAVAIPPTPLSTKLGARIEHITPTTDNVLLSTTIAQHLALPDDFVHRLLGFGAVYYCPVHPPPPPGLPDADMQRVCATRAAGLSRLGRPPLHEEQVPRRMVEDCIVEPWSYVRVHVHPKRFPLAHAVDWKSRVLFQNDAFVVLNKPPGVTVVPRVDNCLECCTHMAAQALGLPSPLLATHRLDTYTEGVLVMATGPQHVQWFNNMLQRRGGSRGQGDEGGEEGGGQRDKKKQKKKIKALNSIGEAGGGGEADGDGTGGQQPSGTDGQQCHVDLVSSQQSTTTSSPHTASPVIEHETPTRMVTKVYRTLTAAPPTTLGVWRDIAWVNVRLQGLPSFTVMVADEQGDDDDGSNSHDDGQGDDGDNGIVNITTTDHPPTYPPSLYGKQGQPAVLEVLQVHQVQLTGPAATRWGPMAYESHVRLVTGRTHQIRAQFASRGCPLLGDPLYTMLHGIVCSGDGGHRGGAPEEIVERVKAAHAAFNNDRNSNAAKGKVNVMVNDATVKAPAGSRASSSQQPPAGTPRVLQDAQEPMGLQAWQLHVHAERGPLGGPCVLKAGVPWWRAEEKQGEKGVEGCVE